MTKKKTGLAKEKQIKNVVELDQVECPTLGAFCFTNQRPLQGVSALLDWRLEGRISRRLKSELFVGEEADHLLLWEPRYDNGRKVFLFGLGEIDKFNPSKIKNSCEQAVKVMLNAGVSDIVFLAPKLYADTKLENKFIKAIKANFGDKVKTVLYQGQIDE